MKKSSPVLSGVIRRNLFFPKLNIKFIRFQLIKFIPRFYLNLIFILFIKIPCLYKTSVNDFKLEFLVAGRAVELMFFNVDSVFPHIFKIFTLICLHAVQAKQSIQNNRLTLKRYSQ